jgi:hypothetical protein
MFMLFVIFHLLQNLAIKSIKNNSKSGTFSVAGAGSTLPVGSEDVLNTSYAAGKASSGKL